MQTHFAEFQEFVEGGENSVIVDVDTNGAAPTTQSVKMADGFGERLKQLRKRVNMTQQELAHAAGISLSTLTNMEQGRKGEPTWKTVRKLAKVLGVSVAEFETDDDPNEAEPPTEPPKPAAPKKRKPKP